MQLALRPLAAEPGWVHHRTASRAGGHLFSIGALQEGGESSSGSGWGCSRSGWFSREWEWLQWEWVVSREWEWLQWEWVVLQRVGVVLYYSFSIGMLAAPPTFTN